MFQQNCPADDASRGLNIKSFLVNKRWINDPEFLWKSQSEWPSQETNYKVLDDDIELKK